MQRTGDRLTKRSGKKRIFFLTKNVDVAHVPHPLGEVGLVMRRPWRSARFERERSTDLRLALFAAPFGLLFVTLLAVKTADSSSSFRIDNQIVLASLKRRIAAADAKSAAIAGLDLVAPPVADESLTELRVPELREVRPEHHVACFHPGARLFEQCSSDEVDLTHASRCRDGLLSGSQVSLSIISVGKIDRGRAVLTDQLETLRELLT